jgi:hypothetical protein
MSEINRLKLFPESWNLSLWTPSIDENCRVTESHGVFNKNEIVVVETTIPGQDFLFVSKLLDPSVRGEIPKSNLEQLN